MGGIYKQHESECEPSELAESCHIFETKIAVDFLRAQDSDGEIFCVASIIQWVQPGFGWLLMPHPNNQIEQPKELREMLQASFIQS